MLSVIAADIVIDKISNVLNYPIEITVKVVHRMWRGRIRRKICSKRSSYKNNNKREHSARITYEMCVCVRVCLHMCVCVCVFSYLRRSERLYWPLLSGTLRRSGTAAKTTRLYSPHSRNVRLLRSRHDMYKNIGYLLYGCKFHMNSWSTRSL